MNFLTSLTARWRAADSLLCVGLDPDSTRIPRQLEGRADAVFEFCRGIVDATADQVCAFKPQIAYFAAQRAEAQLEALISYIHQHHAGIPVILDAKRGDMGSTAEQYAREVFERYGADAVTVSPYLGFDSIEPYLRWQDRGVIALCRTSNPGGSDLQQLKVGTPDHPDAGFLYEQVARLAAGRWNTSGQLALVVGATYPAELQRVRELVGDMPLLVPGIGAQGGDVEAVMRAGQRADGLGLIISSSRAILYAGRDEAFADAARTAASDARNQINQFRTPTS